jgi:hypothetical protein
MSTQPATQDILDSVNEPRHPFGLPLGSVRGFMALLICAFFWMVLLWPDDVAKPLLGHFFLLALVLMAFASSPSPRADGEGSAFLPWLLRVLFVGGSVAVVLLVLFTHPDRLKDRLTPGHNEFQEWWGPFLATMAVGFAAGLFLRFVLGREHPLFQTLRAWLSVVGLLMLAMELALFVVFTTAENKQIEFFYYWQAVELAFVSAYFGTRA